MVTQSKQKAAKKKSRKGRVKSLYLKPGTIKVLTDSQKKKVKGGGGAPGGVVPMSKPAQL